MSVWEKLDKEFGRFPMMVASGVPDETIDAAQVEIGCRFADSYRQFLRRYGGGLVGDSPILGLACADAMGNDLWSVSEVTERFRQDNWPGVKGWYIVSVDGSGNPLGINELGEVWVSDHDSQEIALVASSFEEFLELKLGGA